MGRYRRIATALLTLVAAFTIGASSALATTDTYYGHLNHDGSLTWFTSIQRHHATNNGISVQPTNGPNANGAMRMGLAWQVGGVWTQFTNSVAISSYGGGSNYSFTDVNTGSSNFSARWFIIDARMVNACGIFCDDDFGGGITF